MFDKFVTVITGWAGAIIIIVFVLFIIKDILEIIKGQGGSVLKTVGKVLFVFVMVGVIFAARGYKTIGNNFNSVATNAINKTSNEAGALFK